MSSYNLKYTIGENLREQLDSQTDVAAYLKEQIKVLPSLSDPQAKVKLLGKIGGYQRILQRFPDALETFHQALTLINQHQLDERLLIANTIRIAHVLHWMNDFTAAEQMLKGALKHCSKSEATNSYRHFTHQHLGKVYFDAGQLREAQEQFELALKLRLDICAPELIESTSYALAMNERRMKSSGDPS